MNAADVYRKQFESERTWAMRQARAKGMPESGAFSVFMSSSTEPFQPLEQTLGVTRQVLEAMVVYPPDLLIVQSHSHHVADYLELYSRLAERTSLRFHVSIESDRDELPSLPRPGSTVAKRMAAAKTLREAGWRVAVMVAPLLPIENPQRFFEQLAEVTDAVVIDHFIEGDGSKNGARTKSTPLPVVMEAVQPGSASLDYRQRIVEIAKAHFPGRVGVNIDGFAERFF
jgi:DNA repair photolyase